MRDAVANADSISPSPSVWGEFISSWPEYRRVSPVLRRIWPDCVHLVLLRTAMLYCLISVETCAVFPVSNMVQIFHVLMVVIALVERRFSTVCHTQSLWAAFPSQNMSWWIYSRWHFWSSYSFYGVGLLTPCPNLLLYPGLGPARNQLISRAFSKILIYHKSEKIANAAV